MRFAGGDPESVTAKPAIWNCRDAIASRWYAVFHALICRVYFSRISVLHRERLAGTGPVLFIGLHRNGAVDGFIYRHVIPGTTFLISTQLRKSILGRLFFCGIEVARNRDEGDRDANAAALAQCVNVLGRGEKLFIFPEGTSSLGPRHLPFKSGAARIAAAYLETNDRPLRVIPVGIHYECAWSFRSRVEVVIGEPTDLALPDGRTHQGQVIELRRRFNRALEGVGFNVATAAHQHDAERLAYAATLGTARSYAENLKNLEREIPAAMSAAFAKFQAASSGMKLARHQGVPLFAGRAVGLYALLLLLLSPIVAAGFVLNAFPVTAAYCAAQARADDRNVISLWRILVGAPLFLIWHVGIAITFACRFGWPSAAAYFAVTWAAIASWYRVKKLAVAVHNSLRHPSLANAAYEFHQQLLKEMPAHARF